MSAGKQHAFSTGTLPSAGRTRELRRTAPASNHNSSRDFARLYEGLSEALPTDRIFFLNPGCAEPRKQAYGWLAPDDRAEKYHFNLVRRVLSGVNLTGRGALEIGSGRGGNCRYLARYTDARSVVGVDLDAGNVRFSRRAHGFANVAFIRGDAEQLPLRDAAVDVVLSLASAHCCDDFGRFLSEAHRVLKPGGVFCLADAWSLEPLDLDWEARSKALEASGFRVRSEEDLSEPVYQALEKKDGLPRRLRALAAPATRQLLNRAAESLEMVGLHLATAQCSYKLWRLKRP